MRYIKGVNKGDFIYCKKSGENIIEGNEYNVFAVAEEYSLYCMIWNEIGTLTTYSILSFEEHFETKFEKRSRIIDSLL